MSNEENLVSKILSLLEGFKKARSINQKERASVELAVISGAADLIANQYKQALMDAEVYALFPEYELKVEYTPPKSQSHIDAIKLAKKLIKDGRIADLLKIISISDKDLKTLEDGEVLSAKYRVADPDPKAGLKIGKMTKVELKEAMPQK
jgi:hypothetical protein